MSFLFTPTYLRDPPAFFHPRILVGPGAFLSPAFVTKYGITHVINCSHDDYSPIWWRSNYPTKYKLIEAIDSTQHNILDWYSEFEQALHSFLKEGTGVVYVHCQAGMNRSASLALAYTSKNMGMDVDQMIQSARRQRPCILQNLVFMNQVREFINGRVQDSKDEGQFPVEYSDRYARFFTPRDSPESERYKDETSGAPKRVERSESGNITPVFYK